MEFSLSHQRDVDAVSSCYGNKRNKPSYQATLTKTLGWVKENERRREHMKEFKRRGRKGVRE